MTDGKAGKRTEALVFEYELDSPPEKVWRAISIPAFLEKWLPGRELADTEPVSATPGEEVSYRMRDDEPPFLESVVSFRIRPGSNGGTIFRIVHGLTDARIMQRTPPVANNNAPSLMRAA